MAELCGDHSLSRDKGKAMQTDSQNVNTISQPEDCSQEPLRRFTHLSAGMYVLLYLAKVSVLSEETDTEMTWGPHMAVLGPSVFWPVSGFLASLSMEDARGKLDLYLYSPLLSRNLVYNQPEEILNSKVFISSTAQQVT